MRVSQESRGPGTGHRGPAAARVTVKICGLTNPEDARNAHEAGADFLGFVFFPASRRCLSREDCAWVRGLPGEKVGVFRDQPAAFVAETVAAAGLRWVQLHGDETPEECAALGGRPRVIKAVSVAGPIDWGRVKALATVARVLFDTASPSGGGTGRTFDWSRLDERPEALDFWLAGGLSPDNVAAAIARVGPSGVDVASGVEASLGRKDRARVEAFVAAVHGGPPVVLCRGSRTGR